MSRKKLHIDQLFKEGLKNFSLFVSDRDFNAIDDKTSVFKDQPKNEAPAKPDFSNFELEISENDWLSTKAKLDIEKNLLSTENTIANTFQDFSVEPDPQDWPITLDKLKKAKRRRVAFWWLSTGILLLIAGSAALLSLSDSHKNNQSLNTENAVLELPKKSSDVPKPSYYNNSTNNSTESQTPDKVDQPLPHSLEHAQSQRELPKNTSHEPRTTGSGNLSNQKNESIKNPTNSVSTSVASAPVISQESNLPEDKETSATEPSNTEVLIKTAETSLSDDQTKQDSTKKQAKNDKTPTDPPQPNLHFYLALVNQVDYTNRILPNSNNAIYNNIRNHADKALIQYTSGIEAGVLKDKYQVSTGLNYTTQTWKSQYNYTYKLFDSIPVYDSGRTVIKGYFLFPKKDTTMNELRSVSITKIQLPVNYTRLWTINDKLKLSAGVSGILSYNIKSKGDKMIAHENRQLYYYQRLQSYERPLNFSPNISLGLLYKIQPHLMLAGSLGGNINLRSRFKPGFGAKEYAYSSGINIKLIYLLK